MQSKFAKVPERPNFPEEEEKVLKYWEQIDAFKKQLEQTKGKPQYTFYDGPPFATGLPHYGHIAAGTIKDVVTRYATMKGHYVERRFGWDCHGLPIEYEIDKRDKITSSVEREAIGVKEYNRRCREIVMTYSKEWRNIVGRFGRWIDFDNDYKTMDCKFMESVWWTFKQIYDKGLVYRGSRIMPFSTACNTVLSNFEAGSNYKDVNDPAIIVTFPMEEDKNVSFIAWTTTPWTLPSNLALAINPTFTYVKILDEEKQKTYILAEPRLKETLKQANIKKHKVLEKIPGKDLEGKKYVPLFEYFGQMRTKNCFQVIAANFVTADTGTGIVHCAPGFGEDDYQACLEKGLIESGKAPTPIDFDGKFTDPISDYKGVYIKDADNQIKEHLKAQGRIVSIGTIIHSYPFCWRSQTPLIYRAFDTWFIKVTEIKQQLIENNKNSKWVPAFVQEKRFHNWLTEAKDWCFSRNRYWGNPIPLWISEDGEEVVCVGSIKELQELSGCGEITDLHREFIDNITIPSKQGKGVLRRIPEVFDCWFESGSMPFAQIHYPFSIQEEEFQQRFPANFIAEGLDQTRGWFYTLMVISTAVKGREPFKNLIVNGIVLAEDGSKMSKSKKNYPDPLFIAHQFGADACRLYLCNSPVVRAEPLKFSSDGVRGIVRDVFLPWFNAYRFLIQNISRWEKLTGQNFVFDPTLKEKLEGDANSNIMDRWIIAANQNLIKFVRNEMDNYRLYNVVRHMLQFLEELTNWYVRLNRSRMKGEEGVQEQQVSLNTLFDVLLNTTIMMSCITPFLTDYIYQNLRNGINPQDKTYYAESIHFLNIPEYKESLLNEKIEKMVQRMQSAIEIGRKIRDTKNISIKTPLSRVIIVQSEKQAIEDLKTLQNYIKEELNCLDFEIKENEEEYVIFNTEPDNKEIGSVLKNLYTKQLKEKLANLTRDEIVTYLKEGKININGVDIQEGWLKISKQFNDQYQKDAQYAVSSSLDTSVMLVTTLDENLKGMGIAREIVNKVQKLRKAAGLNIDDQVEIYYETSSDSETLKKVLDQHISAIRSAVKVPFLDTSYYQPQFVKITQTEYQNPDNEQETVKLFITVPNVAFDNSKLQEKLSKFATDKTPNFVNDVKSFVLAFDRESLKQRVEKDGGVLRFRLNDQPVELVYKEDFFLSTNELVSHKK